MATAKKKCTNAPACGFAGLEIETDKMDCLGCHKRLVRVDGLGSLFGEGSDFFDHLMGNR